MIYLIFSGRRWLGRRRCGDVYVEADGKYGLTPSEAASHCLFWFFLGWLWLVQHILIPLVEQLNGILHAFLHQWQWCFDEVFQNVGVHLTT